MALPDATAPGSLYVDGDGELWRAGATGAEDTFVAASEYVYENGYLCPEDNAYHLRGTYGACEGCGSTDPHPDTED